MNFFFNGLVSSILILLVPPSYNPESLQKFNIDYSITTYQVINNNYNRPQDEVIERKIKLGNTHLSNSEYSIAWVYFKEAKSYAETKGHNQYLSDLSNKIDECESYLLGRASTFEDSRDGYSYNIVSLSNGQTWFAENLRINIPGSSCFNNDVSYCSEKGRLYTWELAKRACPQGWRLPNNIDYNRLIQFYKAPKSIGWDSYSTLDFLKPGGLSGWQYDTKIGIYSRWTIGNTRASFVKAGKYWTSEKSEDKNPGNVYVFLGYRDPFPSELPMNEMPCRCIKN